MTITRTGCLVLLAVALSAQARAAHADPAPPAPEPRNRETARELSLGGTLASAVIAGAGGLLMASDRHQPAGPWLIGIGAGSTLFTPLLGEWYAERWGGPGLDLRVAGIGVGLIGVAAYFVSGSRCQQFGDQCFGGTPHDPGPATVLISIGAVVYLGGIVYDIVRAPDAADRYNQRHLQIAPIAVGSATGLHAGLGLSAAF
ncbi:MAG TPA: hypothetical protein VHW23_24190 [Kofleriaceae bacterium]|nr:hypothetical protein [Kofleriaceae bacterium]